MDRNTRVRYAASALGLLLLLLGAAADLLPGSSPGLGTSQVLLLASGALLGLSGVLLGQPRVATRLRAVVFTNTFLVLGSLAAGLVAIEVAFQVLEKTVRRAGNPYRTQQDPRLRVRLEPRGPDIDRNGWRNPEVPARAEIVAIGDSQTYGYGAESAETWPAALGRLDGRTVYNMSLGDYGPLQYLVLQEESRSLAPAVTLVALYLGNDLWNAYTTAYDLPAHAAFRAKDPPPGIERDTVDELKMLFENAYIDLARQVGASPLDRLRPYLATVRVLRGKGVVGRSEAADFRVGVQWAERYPALAFYDPRIAPPTIFSFIAVFLNQNRDEVRIREGLRITNEVLLRIAEGSRESGSRLLVLTIPTKEAVYYPALSTEGFALPAILTRAVRHETANREDLLAHCAASGIETFDLLPGLQESLAAGTALFRRSVDSHYTPAGYAAIAEAVHDELRRRGW